MLVCNGYLIVRKEFIVAYVISDECTMCGSCEASCPTDAIKAGDPKYVIDPETCVDCGVCADECPVDAISPGN